MSFEISLSGLRQQKVQNDRIGWNVSFNIWLMSPAKNDLLSKQKIKWNKQGDENTYFINDLTWSIEKTFLDPVEVLSERIFWERLCHSLSAPPHKDTKINSDSKVFFTYFSLSTIHFYWYSFRSHLSNPINFKYIPSLKMLIVTSITKWNKELRTFGKYSTHWQFNKTLNYYCIIITTKDL